MTTMFAELASRESYAERQLSSAPDRPPIVFVVIGNAGLGRRRRHFACAREISVRNYANRSGHLRHCRGRARDGGNRGGLASARACGDRGPGHRVARGLTRGGCRSAVLKPPFGYAGGSHRPNAYKGPSLNSVREGNSGPRTLS
jgi:hypothetical protein